LVQAQNNNPLQYTAKLKIIGNQLIIKKILIFPTELNIETTIRSGKFKRVQLVINGNYDEERYPASSFYDYKK
jgi:hypothetical protein